MKEMYTTKSYRNKYKRYFGIEFNECYAVHHIDLNRENNAIENLLLLPKELHSKYHFILNALSLTVEKHKADGLIDVRLSDSTLTGYGRQMLSLLPETLNECAKWHEWKIDNYTASGRLRIFGK